MKKSFKIFSIFQLSSTVLMMVLLCWLTISTPFVYASQQEQAKQGKMVNTAASNASSEEENGNPFGNNTEEKTASSSSFSEEYLHICHITTHFHTSVYLYHKLENAATYTAYHGELLVPPPNVT